MVRVFAAWVSCFLVLSLAAPVQLAQRKERFTSKPDASSKRLDEVEKEVKRLSKANQALETRISVAEQGRRPPGMTSYEEQSLVLQGQNLVRQNWVFGLQLASLVAALFVAGIYYKQLTVAHQASRAQVIFALMNFLQDNEIREARDKIIREVNPKDYDNWRDETKKYASTVCSSYAAVGYSVRLMFAKDPKIRETFIEGWGPSILKCYPVVEPHIRAMRKLDEGGPTYWRGFDWLHDEAKKWKASERVAELL